MKKRIVLAISLMIVLIGLFGVASEVKSVEAGGTIYIRADGSIDPPTAPISSVDNVTYTFTDNIYDSIIVQRDNIVVDGAVYTLQGTGSGKGIDLSDRSNVTIKNMKIKAFSFGIWLNMSSSNSISGNNVTNNEYGISLSESSNNTLYHNNFIDNTQQVHFYQSGNANFWDDGYPSGGNYWSDYTEEDTMNGVLNPVLFVHGWRGSKHNWNSSYYPQRRMKDKFFSDGWPREILYAFTFSDPANSTVNARNAEEIAAWVDQILAETGAEKVDLVSFSMGGMSTRYYIKFLDGIDKVDDYVCLGTPQHGTMWVGAEGDLVPDSDFLEKLNDGDETPGGVLPDTEGWRDDPVGEGGYNGAHVSGDITWTTIRSSTDGLMIPPETVMLDGAVNLECSGIDHAGLLSDEQVYEWVKAAIGEGDVIGDAPYVLDANNRDSYPLMGPFNTFDAGTWNGATYNVDVVSNSTVSDLHFNPDEGPFIRINVTGLNNTTGFSRVAIPKQLLWVEEGQWVVLVGGEPVVPTVTEDADYTYLYYFTYSHSTKTVIIQGTHVIPEFPTWTSMLFILIVLTVAIAIYKRRLLKTHNH